MIKKITFDGDSLGEFLALAASFEHFANVTKNSLAKVMADALDNAPGLFLDTNKSPARNVNELDNRGSHFYLAMYWAQALAEQKKDASLAAKLKVVANELTNNEDKIVDERNAVQGGSMDVVGYYKPDFVKASAAMRPSETLNKTVSKVKIA